MEEGKLYEKLIELVSATTGSVIQKLTNGTEASTSEWSGIWLGTYRKSLQYENKKDQVFCYACSMHSFDSTDLRPLDKIKQHSLGVKSKFSPKCIIYVVKIFICLLSLTENNLLLSLVQDIFIRTKSNMLCH